MLNNLKQNIYNKISEKNLFLSQAEQQRLDKELYYIEQGGLAKYFVYYYKLVEICKKLKIVREPESGSIACWYVNYILGIIYRNPLVDEYDFEQFFIPSKIDFSPFQITVPMGYAEIIISELENEIELFSETCISSTTDKKLLEYEIVKENQEHFSTWSIFIAEDSSLNRIQEIVKKLPEQLHPQNLPLNDSQIIQQSEYKNQMESFRVLKPNISKTAIIQSYNHLLPEIFNGNEVSITSHDQVIKIAVEIAGLYIEDAVILYQNCWKNKDFDWLGEMDFEQIKKFINKIRAGARKNSFLTKNDINKLIYEIDNAFFGIQERSIHSSQKRSTIIFDYWLAYFRYYFDTINQLYEDKVLENKHYISDDEKTIDLSFLDFADLVSYENINNVNELRGFLLSMNLQYKKKVFKFS